MKVINIHNCSECPFKETQSSGTKTACGHLKIKVKLPYSKERLVNPLAIAEFCPL